MRYVLVLLGLMFANVANAMDCEKVPDCESLGYSSKEDPYCADNGYMYCPFNHDYKKCVNMDCTKLGFTESDKSSWCAEIIKCQGYQNLTLCNCLKPRCNIGDVFYADGTCGDVSEYESGSGKTPVGVVYATNCAGGGKVINLKNLTRKTEASSFDPADPYNAGYNYLSWGYEGYDIPDVKNYDVTNTILTSYQNKDPDVYDGKGNTAKILAANEPECKYATNTKEYYQYCIPQAAQAARDFYPQKGLENDTRVGAGRWYFPAIGEIMDLYGYDNTNKATGATKEKVNATLLALKSKNVTAEQLTNHWYWSSTENTQNRSWMFSMSEGKPGHDERVDHNYFRVSLEF